MGSVVESRYRMIIGWMIVYSLIGVKLLLKQKRCYDGKNPRETNVGITRLAINVIKWWFIDIIINLIFLLTFVRLIASLYKYFICRSKTLILMLKTFCDFFKIVGGKVYSTLPITSRCRPGNTLLGRSNSLWKHCFLRMFSSVLLSQTGNVLETNRLCRIELTGV